MPGFDRSMSGPYRRLRVHRREICVLDLLPDKNDSPIWCRLRTISLDESTTYETLSYTWGIASEGRSVTLSTADGSDHAVGVTDNLYQALRSLTPRWRRRIIWVDALCINQADTAERSLQVGIMAEIYRSACCVNIWLGTTDPIRYWHWLRNPLDILYIMESPRHWHSGVNYKPVNTMRAFYSLVTLCPQQIDQALDNASPRWLDLAWVIQEFVSSRTQYLCFGNRRIRYDDRAFAIMGDLLRRNLKSGPSFEQFRERIDDKFMSLKRFRFDTPYSNLSKPSLRDAATFTRDTTASDPRDKVYCLLGMIDTATADLIRPDYSVAIWSTYATATYASLVTTQTAAIL